MRLLSRNGSGGTFCLPPICRLAPFSCKRAAQRSTPQPSPQPKPAASRVRGTSMQRACGGERATGKVQGRACRFSSALASVRILDAKQSSSSCGFHTCSRPWAGSQRVVHSTACARQMLTDVANGMHAGSVGSGPGKRAWPLGSTRSPARLVRQAGWFSTSATGFCKGAQPLPSAAAATSNVLRGAAAAVFAGEGEQT